MLSEALSLNYVRLKRRNSDLQVYILKEILLLDKKLAMYLYLPELQT